MPPFTASVARRNLRLCWTFRGQDLGLAIAVAAILLVCFLAMPRGQRVVQIGVVTGLHHWASGRGERMSLYADVAVAGQNVTVTLGPDNACAIGSPIILQRLRTRLGQHYAAQERGCRPPLPRR
jgi:hypothetical protein